MLSSNAKILKTG